MGSEVGGGGAGRWGKPHSLTSYTGGSWGRVALDSGLAAARRPCLLFSRPPGRRPKPRSQRRLESCSKSPTPEPLWSQPFQGQATGREPLRTRTPVGWTSQAFSRILLPQAASRNVLCAQPQWKTPHEHSEPHRTLTQ